MEKEKCIFEEIVEHMTDPDNVWNPQNYVQSRTLHGKAFGQEAQIRYQYCRGSAYAEGMIGDHKFHLFFNNVQGFQHHWVGKEGNEFDPPMVKSYGPDRETVLLGIVKGHVTPYNPTPTKE